MGSWSLRWRILAEVLVLVAVTTIAATLYDVPGAVVVGILAVAAGAVRARQLSSQFSRMTEDVLRTASIDRSHRIDPVGPAELSRMARAVNRLADRLVRAMRNADEERERLGLILESMAEGVLLIDEDGIVEFANPAATALLGRNLEYTPGGRLISLNNNYELNELAILPARTGRSGNAQIEIRDSGKVVQANASPLDDRDGRRKSVLILSDITALRQIDTTRREFVSNASHELRTPIAAIRAATETLQRGAGEDPEARADFLARILEDSNRIELMVSEMLELSRLESRQTTLHVERVEPTVFLEQLKERFEPLASQTSINILVNVADGTPHFSADPPRLEQVFSNLISNAIKAMPDGGAIELFASQEGSNVQFLVKDGGPGIQPVHLPHIFERFYKVDSSRSDGGTGLGLAISRHIVEIHGGEISVNSVVGVGTTFTILMPIVGSPDPGEINSPG